MNSTQQGKTIIKGEKLLSRQEVTPKRDMSHSSITEEKHGTAEMLNLLEQIFQNNMANKYSTSSRTQSKCL